MPRRRRGREGDPRQTVGGSGSGAAVGTVSDAKLAARSGRGVAEWFEILDAEAATRLSHDQIVDLLVEVYEAPDWGAQTVAVRYQREHGIPLPGEQPDGTFTVAASRSLSSSQAAVFDLAVAEASRLASSDPSEIHRLPERTLAVWPLESGDRLEVRVAQPRNGRCALTLEESRIRLPERVADLRARLERAVGRIAEGS